MMMENSWDDDDINDSQVNEYKELSYKFFRFRTHRLRCSNGDFGCPFCDYKEDHENRHIHLLLHAIRAGEEGAHGRKQMANHLAMAKYLAIDLAHELKAEAERTSQSEDEKRSKRPRLDEDASKGEMEAADRVLQLEKELDEMTDVTNSVILRERQSNDELLRGRRELMKGLDDISRGNRMNIGIKRMGEIDSIVFITEMEKRFSPEIAAVKGLELCSSWQENLKNPDWHPFRIIVDDEGKPQRLLKEDDQLLQGLKEEWGREIHDAVVEALNKLHEYNPSGCYVVPELWNFAENRKAELDEAVCCILEAVKDVGSCSNEASWTSGSEMYERKEIVYGLLQSEFYEVVTFGVFRCPFCCAEEARDYDYLLRHALTVAECSSSDAEMRGQHFALAKYLVIDLQDYAEPSPSQNARYFPAFSVFEDFVASPSKSKRCLKDFVASPDGSDEDNGSENDHDCESDGDDCESEEETPEMDTDQEDEGTGKEALENLLKEKEDLQCSFRNLLTREAKGYIELKGAREELIKVLNDRESHSSSEIGLKQMGEIDLNVVKRVCSKRFRASEAETAAVALCSAWQEKLKNTQWRPFETVEDDYGKLQIVVKEDESLRRLKQFWGDGIHSAVVTALKDLCAYCPARNRTVAELWNYKKNRKAELKEAIRFVTTTTTTRGATAFKASFK